MQLSNYKNSFHIYIISLFLACNGEDGAVGPSGLNSLIQTSTETSGSNCEFGGLKIESGVDNNSNGTLESDEIAKTDYVCSVAGSNSLVNVSDEPIGVICAYGGIKIESGVDDNSNGILDSDEIDITRYVCNGVDGVIDEQIQFVILDLGTTGVGNLGDQSGRLYGGIVDFNKTLFNGVDSAIFVTEAIFNNGFVELYDETNGVLINNSSITSSGSDKVILRSGNIFDDLPPETINIAIRSRSGSSGQTVWLYKKSYLILYRRN